MNLYEQTVLKINRLPKELIVEVNDFIDYLIFKQEQINQNLQRQEQEQINLAESDFSNYLQNLEEYEERLAKGEIQW